MQECDNIYIKLGGASTTESKTVKRGRPCVKELQKKEDGAVVEFRTAPQRME